LLCNTYLEFFLREELLDEMELYPFNESFPEEHFRTPPVLAYEQYFEYIDSEMPGESPVAFGMHPNAEIAVKTTQSDFLFQYVLELQPRSGGGDEEEGSSPQARVQQMLSDIMERLKGIKFNLDDLATAVVDDRGPYQNVFLQECDRMNALIAEILRSLKELELGLSGELQMSVRMEGLQNALFVNRVPATWEKLAYPSLKPLGFWLDNLINRTGQLQSWTEEPVNIPIVTQLNFMFNPQSFLTAIMQITAQKQKMELDKLVIMTDVTRKTVEQTESRAREGAYVSGLYLEGARWNWNTGLLEECEPREMFCELPVVTCRAILADKQEKSGVYMCPTYKTQSRGQHYVFTASLRTKMPAAKWILTGCTLLLEAGDN
jgi:dynein heavy chain